MMDNLTIEMLSVLKKIEYNDSLYKNMNEIIGKCISNEIGTSEFFNYVDEYTRLFSFNPFTGTLSFVLYQSMPVDKKELDKIILLNSDCRITQYSGGKFWEIDRDFANKNDSVFDITIRQN